MLIFSRLQDGISAFSFKIWLASIKKKWLQPRKRSRKVRLQLETLEDRITPAIDLSQFKTFLPQALTAIQTQGITAQLYQAPLPLIGNLLSGTSSPTAANVLGPVQTQVQTALNGLSANPTQTTFENAFKNQLGSLLENPVALVSGDPSTTAVEYQFTIGLTQANALTSSVALDAQLGLAGLGIKLSQSVPATLSVWYTDTVAFGVNNGVYYIDTSNSALSQNVKVSVANGATVQGSVGLLQFSATSQAGASGAGTGVQMAYTASLSAPNHQLTQANLNTGVNYQGATASLNANINLQMTAQFGGSAINPSVQTNFVFGWATTGNPEVSSSFGTSAPQTVAFNNVTLNAQNFFQNFVEPILQNINTVVAPLEPIVSALEQKPISWIDLTYLQILETFLGLSPSEMDYFDAVTDLINLVSAANAAANSSSGTINLGSFNLNDPRSGTDGIASSAPNTNAMNDLQTADGSFFSALTTLNGVAANSGLNFNFLTDPTLLFKLFIGDPDTPLISFTLPQLQVGVADTVSLGEYPLPPLPYPFVNLTLGIQGGIGLTGNLTMGYDDQGLIDFQANPSNTSALLDGLYIDTTQPLLEISGWAPDAGQTDTSEAYPGEPSSYILSFVAAVNVGDNLSEFAEAAGISLPSWFGDVIDAASPLTFEASGQLQVGLMGSLDVGLNGGADDRFRLAQLNSGQSLFDVSGSIGIGGDVTISASASANIPGFSEVKNFLGKVTGHKATNTQESWSYGPHTLYKFPTIPLFTFNSDGNLSQGGPTQGDTDPQLATLEPSALTLDAVPLPAGTLVLNVGPDAGNRNIDPADTNADYVIDHVSGSPDVAGGETVNVTAYGVTEQFTGVTAIYANTGSDDDQIQLDDSVLAPSYLQAGSGTVTLKAGAGPTTLVGGSGDDTLIGGPVSGVDNIIISGTGNNTITGGAGDDSITILGDGTNQITGGGGNDTVIAAGNQDFSLVTDTTSENTQLIGASTSTLTQIKSVQLTGDGTGQTFTVQNWGGTVSLTGQGVNDQYVIGLVGSGSSSYSVDDAVGDGTLLVTGSPYGDDLTLKNGSLTDNDEAVTYSGIQQLTVQAGTAENTINVQGTTAGMTTTVLGGTASNLISISSNAGADNNGVLSAIQGTLYIDAGSGGANRLIVSNFGSTQQQSVLLTSAGNGYMAIEQMAPAPIYYKATGGGYYPFENGASIAGYDPNFGVILRGSQAASDQFDIQSTSATAPTQIEGDATNNTFIVSSDAGAQSTPAGDLNGIQGDLTVVGGSGTGNRLIVGDAGDLFGGKANVVLATTTIAGTTYQQVQNFAGSNATTNINYTAAGTFNHVIGGVSQGDGILLLGSSAGVNTFNVQNTPSGSTTAIAPGNGPDSVIVSSNANVSGVPSGIPTGVLDDIAGSLTIRAGSSLANSLIVSDLGQTAVAKNDVIQTTTSFGGTAYQQLQNFTGTGAVINYTASGGFNNAALGEEVLLVGSNTLPTTFNVQSTLAGSTTAVDTGLIAGSGYSFFHVGSLAPNSGGVLNNIAGPLLLNGGSGLDVATVDDSGSSSARTGTLTGTAISGLGTAGITDLGMRSLNIALGAGNDSLLVAGTDSASTAINTGGGNDRVTLQSVAGNLLVQGGSGNDTFVVGGSAPTIQSPTGSVVLIGGSGGANQIDASGNVDFTLSNWNLTLSNGDSFSLQSIQQAVLTGGGGDNTFDLSNWTGSGTLIGGGDGTLLSYSLGDQTLTDTSLVRADGGTFILSGIDQADLTGGPDNNILDASGFSGSVWLYGGAGNDTLRAGSGTAYLDGGSGQDTLVGGAGDDTLVGANGSGDIITGGAGTDTIYGSQGADTITGGAGSDTIYGGGAGSFISGGTGPDTIIAGGNNDTIYGNGGQDVIVAGGSNDVIYADNLAGTGDTGAVSYLYGTYKGEAGVGTDTLIGGKGNDFLYGYGDNITGGIGSTIDNSLASNPMPSSPAPVPVPTLAALTPPGSAATLPTGVNYQGRWTEFSGSATAGGLSNSPGQAITPAIATGANGEYVAWADSRSGVYQIDVALLTSGGWQSLGELALSGAIVATSGASLRPSIAVGANGQPIVAWTVQAGAATDIFVAQYDPTANAGAGGWTALANSLNAGGISASGKADDAQIVETASGPVVAYVDRSSGAANVYVQEFVGGQWVALGSGAASGAGVSQSATNVQGVTLATDGSKVGVAWTQNVGATTQVYLREYSGGVWQQLAGSATGNGLSQSTAQAQAPTLAFNNGALFAAWQDSSSGVSQVYAALYNGSAWVAAGSGATSGGGVSASSGMAGQPRLAANDGQLYLMWLDNLLPSAGGNALASFVKPWNGSAFVEQIVGDASYNGIDAVRGAPVAPVFAVDAAGQPFLAWQDNSSGAPQIYVLGDTFTVHTVHYVNNVSTNLDAFTTAAGADTNDGLSPATPKATVAGVFSDASHPVQPGDVIYLDTGSYAGFSLTSAANGAYLLGSPRAPTVIQGAVNIVGAANLTLENITFQGVVTLTDCSNVTFSDSTFTAGVVIAGGSNNQIVHDAITSGGINLGNDSASAGPTGTIIEHNQITGGIAVTGAGITGLAVRFNQIGGGILLNNPAAGTISGNYVAAVGGTALSIRAAFSGSIDNNNFTGANVGVVYQAGAFLSGNQIDGNGTGVISTVSDPASALGFVAGTLTNQIFGNGTGVQLVNAALQNQHVYDNQIGVTGSGTLVPTDIDNANLIELNGVGITGFSGPIEFNRIARNTIGIVAGSGQFIAHNLIYRNVQTAVSINAVTAVQVVNNTFYAPTGDNIDITGAASNIEVQDNILWAESGYDINVANNSQAGFFSDFNDLYATGTGKLVFWDISFTDILDWQDDVNLYDLHSIGSTVVNPLWAQPRFVGLGQDDFRVFDMTAGLRFTSPTIATGNPIIDEGLANPQNLLTDPGFENGLTGWSVNPGAATQGANPSPFAGSQYFVAGTSTVGTATQTINLLAAGYSAAQLDSQSLVVIFGGRIRSTDATADATAQLTLTFLDGSNNVLGHDTVPASNVSGRWELVGDRVAIPAGTRSVTYAYQSVLVTGAANDSALDGAFLSVEANSFAPDQGAYGNTTYQTTESTAPRIALHTPDLYVNWERNVAHLIEWTTYSNTTQTSVRIDLYQEGPNGPQLVANITPGTPDTGEFLWTPANDNIAFGTSGLIIQVSLVGEANVVDRSTETFAVPENTLTYYVNGPSTANAQYSSAPGSNRNTGKTPAGPLPSPAIVLRTYSVGPTQTVFVDPGTYLLFAPLVVSATVGVGDDQGFTMTGPTNGQTAAIGYLNPLTVGPVLDVNNASYVTLQNLVLDDGTIGLWVHNDSTNFTGANLTVENNSAEGIRIETGATSASLTGITAVANGSYGIYVDGAMAALADSTVSRNGNTGIYLNNPGPVQLESSTVFDNAGEGIYVSNNGTSTPVIGDANLSLGLGNIIYGNSGAGIDVYNGDVVGNTVYGQSNSGYQVAGIVLNGSSEATQNVVYGNTVGIVAYGYYYPVLVNGNRVYDNSVAGIEAFGNPTVQGNTVYSNGVGIQASQYETGFIGQLVNNLVYANSAEGIVVQDAQAGAEVINNTVYQLAGDAIQAGQASQDLEVRNNILWVTVGYDLDVAIDSEQGFQSDYNDLYAAGAGAVGFWQGTPLRTLSAWQSATLNDLDSLASNPLFVSPGGTAGLLGYAGPNHDGRDNDFHLQSTTGSYHGGSLAPVVNTTTGLPTLLTGTWTPDAAESPGIDRGAATDSYGNEPAPNGGFINLGSDGNTAEASLSPSQYLNVLRPDGGETWPELQTFPIVWRSQDSAGTVTIQLLEQGNATPVLTIAAGVANNGAFLWTVPSSITPASNFFIQVSRDDLPGVVGLSSAPFTITGPVAVYYVNDATVNPGDWTTNPGSDANDGLTPATPKASIQAVLQAYRLNPGDTIMVDAGTYNLTTNIILGASASGIKIEGYNDPAYPDRQAVLNRGDTNGGSDVVQLAGATGVTLEDLSITGGQYGVYAASGAGSTGLIVSNDNIYGNAFSGIFLDASNDHAQVIGNQVYDDGSTGYSGSNTGISILSLNDQVSGNYVYGNPVGINGSVPYNTASANLGSIQDNTVFGNLQTGIISYYVPVVGNTVYGQTNTGYQGGGIVVNSGTEARQNVVYDNNVGIFAYGYYYPLLVDGNRVYDNRVAGIEAFGNPTVQGNTVYDNGVGIQASQYETGFIGQIVNNLVYANTIEGILVQDASAGAEVANNTVYQAVGDAVQVEQGSQNLVLRNNILWTQSGYDIDVAADSEQGFTSDYNDLYTTATGQIGQWANFQFTTLADWAYDLGLDVHSLAANPQFLNPAGADGVLGYSDTPIAAPQVVDDSSPAFATIGSWSNVQSPNSDFLEADGGSATWTFTHQAAPPPQGQSYAPLPFTANISWPSDQGLGQVNYQATGASSVPVNQGTTTAASISGIAYADSNGLYTIEVSISSGGAEIAVPSGVSIANAAFASFATTSGTWLNQNVNKNFHENTNGNSNDVATWTLSGLTPGDSYRIAATWTPFNNFSTTAQYQIVDGGQVVSQVLVNQTSAPDDFADGGQFWQQLAVIKATGTTLTVCLAGSPGMSVAADAIEFVQVPGDSGGDDDFHVPSTSPTVDAGDLGSPYLAEPAPNGGRANQGYDGDTSQAATSLAQLVQVLAPTGLDKVQVGQPVTISWRSAGLTATQPVVLIDTGGPAVDNWLADSYQTQGSSPGSFTAPVDTSAVANPAPQAVYQSYALAAYGAGNQLAYDLPVHDGTYTVRLDFAEPYQYVGAGQRVFDVMLQGQVVQADYDIDAAAGADQKATALTFTVSATSGSGIALALINDVSSSYPALLSGIEVSAANPAGVANPTANVQLSTDNGATWTTLASGVGMDHLGQGSYTWTPTATTAGATALIRVAANNGTQPQGVSAAFLIANGGNSYYVNDNSTTGDVFTTAVGNNANSGKSPDQPMASLAAVLAAYHPDAGDTIYVDTGVYNLPINLVLTADDSGVRIVGPSNAGAVLNRGNTNNGSDVVQLAGAIGVTLDDLSITGGQYGIAAASGAGSTGLTVSNCDIYANADTGIFLDASNGDAQVIGNQVHDNGFSGGSYNGGIYIGGMGDLVSGNQVYGNTVGINASIPYNTAAANLGSIQDNTVFGNQATGIISYYVPVVGNTVFGQTNTGGQDGGIVVNSGTEARQNVVYGNSVGIYAYGYYDPLLVDGNRVYDNSVVGIEAFGNPTIQGNTVYSNAVGIQASQYETGFIGQLVNNLVYANSVQGILVQNAAAGAQITNNTVYQAVGDAVQVDDASQDVQLENNILWTQAGYDIAVAADSEQGFASDYNDLYTTGAGKLGQWQGQDYTDLASWFYALNQDGHSLTANPQFINPAGADGVLGYSTTSVGAAQIVETGSAGFSTTGAWSTTSGGLSGTVLLHNAGTADGGVASWTFTGLTPGATYQIAATWPSLYNNAYDAQYDVLDGGQAVAINWANQQQTPAGFNAAGASWEVVADVQPSGSTLVVQLPGQTPSGYYSVVADAVMLQQIVGPGGSDDDFHVPSASPTVDAGDPAARYFAEPAPNGGRANQGYDGDTPQAATSPAQLVQMLAPTTLGKVQVGQPVTISWHSAGLTATQPVVLIDTGGPAVSNYLADSYQTQGSSPGSITGPVDTSAVTNPAPQAVYQSYAQAAYGAGNQLAYNLPVPDGAYTVRLDFAEPYQYVGAGQRLFDVMLQGQVVQADYDIVAAAGAGQKATALTFTVSAAGGSGIALALVNDVSSSYPALLSGIEVSAANPAGVANPTANVQLSTDNGATWTTLATGVSMDRFGQGSYNWTPTATTTGATALIRVEANNGTQPQGVSGAFLIANGGNSYYVNDNSTTGDVFTTAVGNNANSGKSPSQPMASLAALLAAYHPDAGDTIYVDTGVYNLPINIVLTAEDSGVRIVGPSNAGAVLNRGNTNNGSDAVQLAGATGVTLDDLSITGGQYGIAAASGADSTGLTVSNCDVYVNADSGIFLDSSNDDAQLIGNQVHDNGFSGGSYNGGIYIGGVSDLVSNNQVYGNTVGIYASISYNTASADLGAIQDNTVFGNQNTGIISYYVPIIGNTVYDQTNTGYQGGGILVNSGTEARQNVVYGNSVGIFAYGYYYPLLVDGNRVYDNSVAGIEAFGNATIQGNTVYSNAVGIQASQYETGFIGQIVDNLVYVNTNDAILVQYAAAGAQITNNTVYQPVGDAVQVENGSQNLQMRNNILWVQSGYDIAVAADSEQGFNSDYNDLNVGTDPNAKVGSWGTSPQNTLAGWQTASGGEAHSISANPQFVDIGGADNILGYAPVNGVYVNGGDDDNFYLSAGSPAINCGDSWTAPATDLTGAAWADDPGTPNPGSPTYVATTSTAGFTAGGVAQGWQGYQSYWTLNLPFAFPFYNSSYTSVEVSSEGFLQFAGNDYAGDSANSTAKLLSDVRIAPLWANLSTAGAGDDIFVDTSVANQITIRWKAVNEANGSPVNVAVTLFSNGQFRFNYGAGNANLNPTVGISMGNGHVDTLAGANGQANLANAGSVLFQLEPGYIDLGAYGFQGSSLDHTPPTAVASASTGSSYVINQLQVTLTKPVNPIDAVAPALYELRKAGSNGFGSANDVVYTLVPQYTANSTVVTLSISGLTGGDLPAGSYRFTIFNNGNAGLHGLNGLLLAGAGNGTPGGNYVYAFTITAAPSLSNSAVLVSPAGIASSTATTVTLQATDVNGNNLTSGGLHVIFALANGSAGGLFSAVKDNGNGTYTATFTGGTVGTDTITATIEGQAVTSAPPTVAVTPLVMSSNTNATTDATSLLIHGAGFDTNAAGDTVTFSGNVTGTVTVATSTQLTVGNLSGLAVGVLSASVTVDGVSSVAPVPIATLVSPPPAKLVFEATTNNATAGQTIPAFKVDVEDTDGSLLTADSSYVVIHLSGPGGFTSGTVQVQDAGGTATFNNLVLQLAGVYTVTATVGALSTSNSVTFTVAANVAANLSLAGANQGAPINAAFANSLTATVTDQFGNPVPGVSVVFSLPGYGASGGLNGGVTGVTGSNGQVAKTLTANAQFGTFSVLVSVVGGSNPHGAITGLTIAPPPSVGVQPTNQTVFVGTLVSFTAAATGTPTPTAQWQVSTSGGPFNNIPGATSATYTFTASAGQAGNQYRAVFTNFGGSATSSAAQLAVNTALGVVSSPVSQAVAIGQTATFSATGSGTPAPTVQWQVTTDGGSTWSNISGATTTALSVTATQAQNAALYRAVFSNSAGRAVTASAALTVNFTVQATTKAQTLTVATGTPVTLTAAATGDPAPSVYWQVSAGVGKTFTPIVGATLPSYSFTTQPGESGELFEAVFSNGIGKPVATAAITLTVDGAPAITTGPTAQTGTAGGTATYMASASGTPAPTVQWQVSTDGGKTFSNVTGATKTALTLTNLAASQDGGVYRAVFTNLAGQAATGAAPLTVQFAPAVTQQPVSQAVAAGTQVTFTAASSADPAATVQWMVSAGKGKTFSAIPGATSLSYSFTAQAGDNGQMFEAVFTNGIGKSATTSPATLTIGVPPGVQANPSNKMAVNGTATFSVTPTGTTPTVQWQVSTNGGTTWSKVPSGGTAATLVLTGLTAAKDQSQYRVLVTNALGTFTSGAATLTVQFAPAVTQQPVSQTVAAGTQVTFTAASSADPAATVQWMVSTNKGANFSSITGATSLSYSFTPQASDSGKMFDAVFTNGIGKSATTTAATLTIALPPGVQANPSSQMAVNGVATFSVVLTGTTPTVQWQVSTNGGTTWSKVTSGGTTATLRLTGLTAAQDQAQYRVLVTNALGTFTSGAATLTVQFAPTVTQQPLSQTVPAGTQVTFTAASSADPAATVQWMVSAGKGKPFIAIPGATSLSYSFTAQAGDNGQMFEAVFTNGIGKPATTTAATLAIGVPPGVQANPSNQTAVTGTATFSVTPTGTTPTVQWQVSTNGGTTWSKVTSGGTTATLKLTGLTAAQDQSKYRVLVTNALGTFTSGAATLTVPFGPVISA